MFILAAIGINSTDNVLINDYGVTRHRAAIPSPLLHFSSAETMRNQKLAEEITNLESRVEGQRVKRDSAQNFASRRFHRLIDPSRRLLKNK